MKRQPRPWEQLKDAQKNREEAKKQRREVRDTNTVLPHTLVAPEMTFIGEGSWEQGAPR